MDASELRARQAPLKARYRETPAAAKVVSRAEGRIDAGGLACAVAGWRAETVAGMHEVAGGDGSEACSADMLLEALVGCAGVTLSAVASALGIALEGGRIVAEGTWDARGTLGVDRTAPVGISDITLTFELDTDAPSDAVERLIATTERYCVVLQTLRNPPRIACRRA
jgi:uncharacterized OsmC-like protein